MDTHTNKDNIFKINAKVFLEGIEIPYSNVSVSYGIDSEPSCSISLPGNMLLRELPDFTHVLVIYKEPQAEDDSPWYVLFDGELEGWSYGVDANSATITLSAIHGTKWLNLMQMIIQEATAQASGMDNIAWSGVAGKESFKINGLTYSESAILAGMFPKGSTSTKFQTMADLVYCIIRSTLSEKLYNAKSTSFFRKKIESEYHLPDRIFGTSASGVAAFPGIIEEIKAKNPKAVSGGKTEADPPDTGRAGPTEPVTLYGKGNVTVVPVEEGAD